MTDKKRQAEDVVERSGFHALERASQILLAFAEADEPSLGISSLSRTLGIPKSSVFRVVEAFCASGILQQDSATRRYALGPKAALLGASAFAHRDLRTVALPFLEQIVRKTSETASFSVRVGWERVVFARLESDMAVRQTARIGVRYPLYAGAGGKAILAAFEDDQVQRFLERVELEPITDRTTTDRVHLLRELKQIRSQGFSFTYGERDPWTASVACAVQGQDGQPLGSLSIGGPTPRISEGTLGDLVPHVVEAARSLSHEFGHTEPEIGT